MDEDSFTLVKLLIDEVTCLPDQSPCLAIFMLGRVRSEGMESHVMLQLSLRLVAHQRKHRVVLLVNSRGECLQAGQDELRMA